jgi:hypothetical protein
MNRKEMTKGPPKALAFVALGAGTLGCTPAFDLVGSATLHSPRTYHAGERISGRLALPGAYDWTVGVEQSTQINVHPYAPHDQSRMGGLVGYARPPHADGRAFGYELTFHAGAVRGLVGDQSIDIGAYSSFAGTLLWRPCTSKDPWDVDGYLRSAFLIAPTIEPGVVMSKDPRAELTVGLSLRYQIWPTVVP